MHAVVHAAVHAIFHAASAAFDHCGLRSLQSSALAFLSCSSPRPLRSRHPVTTRARPLRLDHFGPWPLWDSAVEALVLTLAENRRFLFTCMFLLLLLLSLLLLLVLQPPLSSIFTLLGGITIQSCPFTNHSASPAQTQAQPQTQNKNKRKTMLELPVHVMLPPARAMKCLSPVSGRDADNRSMLSVIDSL